MSLHLGNLWYGKFTNEDQSSVLTKKRKEENSINSNYAGYVNKIRKDKKSLLDKLVVLNGHKHVLTIIYNKDTIIALKSYYNDDRIDCDGNLVLRSQNEIRELREFNIHEKG